MSLTLKELLSGTNYNSLPKEHQGNLITLLERINKVRDAYGKPMTVTSGYRSLKHHIEIYAAKGITDQSKIPMKSNHLSGAACDISDPTHDLQKWCKDNEVLLAQVNLWMEDFSATPNWVHFQILPPKSGNRWFNP